MRKGTKLETVSALYTIEECIGHGGNGEVYRAVGESGQPWAIKVLDPTRSRRDKRKRFMNEMAFAQRNTHANIVTVVDVGLAQVKAQSAPFYVMKLYPSSLKQLLAERRLDPTEALQLFIRILDGVEAAHLLRIIHRDLKPANILYDADSKNAVVADFGIARFSEEYLVTLVETQPSARLANFEYAAPEQRRAEGVIDERTDIYALGLILHEMLMGEVPHGTGIRAISTVHPNLGYLDELGDAMRAQSPSARPASITAIKTRLKVSSELVITDQKLSRFDKAVVEGGQIDDPLLLDPPTVVDYQYDDQNRLIFVLSRPVNQQWFVVFQRISFGSAINGTSPGEFAYHGKAISVRVNDPRDVQTVIQQVKRWLEVTTDDYRLLLKTEQWQREEDARLALKAVKEQEEHRKRMLQAIRDAAG